MINMEPAEAGHTKIEFKIPARGLIGYRTEFLTDTKGEGTMNHIFDSYEPYKGDVQSRTRGTIVAFENGKSITYGLYNAQDKGDLFIGAGVDVYEGMIVGLNSRGEDLAINVCKEKHLTNTRASGSDDALRLVPPIQMSLEKAIEFIQDDELVEITPKSIRLRKKILDNKERERAARNANGEVIMYADTVTRSMENAIRETNRRREIQKRYNDEHGIVPKTIIKDVRDIIEIGTKVENEKPDSKLSRAEKEALIGRLTNEMRQAAKILEFEHAAYLRDRINKLRGGK